MKYLDSCKQIYEKSKKYSSYNPEGCSSAEIAELESVLGEKLPKAYQEFLLWMGKDYNGIYKGSDCFLPDVVSNNEMLPELLNDSGINFSPKQNYVCFFMHQGYAAAWFYLPSEDEDPDIWFFKETKVVESPAIEGKLSEFVYKDMLGLLNVGQ